MLNVSSEGIFHTVQGEGQLVGYPTIFLRLNGCNLRCAWRNPDDSITTCDTPHTSFTPEVSAPRSVAELAEEVLKIDCEHVVITGGEPYLQRDTTHLIDWLVRAGRHVTVETNGTIWRENLASLQSISLKLESSSAHPLLGKRHEKNRLKFESLESFVNESKDYQFKFVLNSESDVQEIERIAEKLKSLTGHDINKKIWVMPQGICGEQLDSKMLWLVALCKQKNWRLSDRLHIRIWGHQKGV